MRASPKQARSKGQQAQQRATSLFLARLIVRKHGGRIRFDLARDLVHIDVPQSKAVVCERDITEAFGKKAVAIQRPGKRKRKRVVSSGKEPVT